MNKKQNKQSSTIRLSRDTVNKLWEIKRSEGYPNFEGLIRNMILLFEKWRKK